MKLWKRREPTDPADRAQALRVMKQLRRQSTAMSKSAGHSGNGSVEEDLRYTVAGPGGPS
ncbi:MAG: hypothetical protein JWO63_3360 [Frankiales bacterium]|nr:hypothetical protein [Frankiales bacterium]